MSFSRRQTFLEFHGPNAWEPPVIYREDILTVTFVPKGPLGSTLTPSLAGPTAGHSCYINKQCFSPRKCTTRVLNRERGRRVRSKVELIITFVADESCIDVFSCWTFSKVNVVKNDVKSINFLGIGLWKSTTLTLQLLFASVQLRLQFRIKNSFTSCNYQYPSSYPK